MSGPSGPSSYPRNSANNSGMNGTRQMPDGPRNSPAGSNPEATPISAGALAADSRGVIGLNGLRLSRAGTDDAPVAVISSAGKNVRLDGGTRLLLGAETPASGVPGQ